MNTKVIAEAGINHNGSISECKKLIDLASLAGCQYVKIQKRNPNICVPKDKTNEKKVVPWRTTPTTYLQYKMDLEFDEYQLAELFSYAKNKEITLFASVWDIDSASIMSNFTHIVKVPSAKLTNTDLLKVCKKHFSVRMLSTGMSTEKEIETAINILDPHIIFHTNSVYPTNPEDLNLGYIPHLKEKYPNKIIGYSSHYFGIRDVIPAIALGAIYIEKHITLNKDTWGSDQKSSLAPIGLFEMINNIKELEKGIRSGKSDRDLYTGEEKKLKSLRG